jgi:1-acyl-sn-glycerol-3-phosphate acyltransferase
MGRLKAILLGIAMFLFGIIAFILAVLALVVSPIFPNLRYSSNLFFIIPFSWFARKLVCVKLVILNKSNGNLHRPCILVGNHQTGMDFAIISQACPGGMLIVAKRELKNIPIFGWFFSIAGNVLIDRSNPIAAKKHMDDARALLRDKNLNLAVFPEGTRSKAGEMLPFKKGAFHLAVSMGYPIVPIVCSSLKGKAIWETGDLNGGYVVVSVLEPVETKHVNVEQIDAFRDEIRNLMVAEFTRVTKLATDYDAGIGDRSASCC